MNSPSRVVEKSELDRASSIESIKQIPVDFFFSHSLLISVEWQSLSDDTVRSIPQFLSYPATLPTATQLLAMVDSVFRTRSLGTPAEGVKDQYADGKAAKVWEVFIGDKKLRTQNYRDFLVGLLRQKKCRRILDVACGTGVDSVMLLEEGFEVVSVDASDKMLKYALKSRWDRRKEPAFDKWGERKLDVRRHGRIGSPIRSADREFERE